MFAYRARLAWGVLAAIGLAAGLRGAEPSPASNPGKTPDPGEVVTLWEAQENPDLEIKFIAKDATAGWLYVKNLGPEDVRIELPLAFVAEPNPPETEKRSAHIEETQVLGGGFAHTKRSQASRHASPDEEPAEKEAPAARADVFGERDAKQGDDPKKDVDSKKDVGPVYLVRGKRSLHLSVPCVCLEYGKPEPNSQLPYKIRPAETFATQAELVELLKRYGQGQVPYGPAQAAAWHLSNHLGWDELAAKRQGEEPLIAKDDLRTAIALVKAIEKFVLDNAPKP